MASWFRSLWQKIKRHPIRTTLISIACVLGIVLLIGGYVFNWTWTGFGPYTPPNSNFQREKTLYDWLQLAIIPLALAVGIWWLNHRQQQRDQNFADQRAKTERDAADKRAQIERDAAEKRAETEREIAEDNQHEAALQAYIDNMSALLLENDLSNQVQLDKVRKIGRVRTLTVLRRCDGKCKAIVLQFLCESDLINIYNKVVDLEGADFSEAELSGAQLSKADLSRANLTRANLIKTNLIEAKLCSTVLIEANMNGAWLNRADLRCVDLSEADLSGAIGISNENWKRKPQHSKAQSCLTVQNTPSGKPDIGISHRLFSVGGSWVAYWCRTSFQSATATCYQADRSSTRTLVDCLAMI